MNPLERATALVAFVAEMNVSPTARSDNSILRSKINVEIPKYASVSINCFIGIKGEDMSAIMEKAEEGNGNVTFVTTGSLEVSYS